MDLNFVSHAHVPLFGLTKQLALCLSLRKPKTENARLNPWQWGLNVSERPLDLGSTNWNAW
jgi:hypothetical protein